MWALLLIFSCPEQLNRWPCHWLTDSGYFTDWHTKSDPRDLWPLRHLIRVMRGHDLTNKNKMTKTNTKTKTMTATVIKTIPKTCDIWDTNYNFDNWELEFITIFVAWQLRVTLDCLKKSQNNSKSSSHNEYLFKCTFQDQIILAVFFGAYLTLLADLAAYLE